MLVRLVCGLLNALLGDTGSRVTAEQERTLALGRAEDPYFAAFRARCMQWVYGDDPRRILER